VVVPKPNSNARPLPAASAKFGRWPFWRRWFGQRSEKAAARFLRKQGFRILAVNLEDAHGEIDLLTLSPDRKMLVVVEVRSVSAPDPQLAADSVNRAKQKKVADATRRFLSRHRLHGIPLRFDILALAWPIAEPEPRFLHLVDAFTAPDRFQFYS
jgi:putative endonuclease